MTGAGLRVEPVVTAKGAQTVIRTTGRVNFQECYFLHAPGQKFKEKRFHHVLTLT
jgi:hypothetical protein